MRELISFSIGRESNYSSTHFWNLQEQSLAYKTEKGSDSSVVMFYERPNSGKFDPRVVFVDYRDNFGNFSSCFSLEQQAKHAKEQATWQGQVELTEHEQIPLSHFHHQLIEYEGVEESKEPEPEVADLGKGQSTRQVFEQFYQVQIDTSAEIKPVAKKAKEKTSQEYYEECDFEKNTKSFTDFM